VSDGGTDRLDFFVSYTQADQAWAEWIAWQLEEAGYRVLIQAWDFRGGDNWAAKVQEGVERADRTIAVLSPAYHDSTVGTVEWLAAWLPDPLGKNRRLLVARVVEVERRGILGQLQSFDLFGLAEKTARERLLAEVGLAVKGGRAKPSQAPRFPDGEAHTGVNTARNDHQPTFPGVVAVATTDEEMLDRGPQRHDLRAALTGKSGQIVIVSGAVGVGKSMLVNKVVGDLQKAGHLHAVYREALASVPLDVRTLTEAMAARGSATVDEAWRGESSVARFEAALGAARDRPLVIVIEQAENLLEPSNRHLRDLDLDEAFEILATDGRHRVSIVLVTRAWPEASSRSLWLSKAHLIPVRDLPVAQLIEYVARLDGRRSTGILDLPREELESFFQALSCNPGNVSLAHTVIGLADIGMDAAELAANLTQQQARDVPRYLAGLLVEDLPNARQQVLNALVAFGIPVDSTASNCHSAALPGHGCATMRPLASLEDTGRRTWSMTMIPASRRTFPSIQTTAHRPTREPFHRRSGGS